MGGGGWVCIGELVCIGIGVWGSMVPWDVSTNELKK